MRDIAALSAMAVLSVCAGFGITYWAIQNGHPTATWLYCDMLQLCSLK